MNNYISFNRTKVKKKKKIIEKEFVLKTIPYNKASIINKNIRDYHATLLKNCNNIPKLISHNKKLKFKFEYCGISLHKILQEKNMSKKKMNHILNEISNILNIFENVKIGIDPHFKNFTILKNKIYFVDFYPPVTSSFTALLIKYNPKIRKQISLHLQCYSYDKIKHHFLADLKKSKNINKEFYSFAKNFFIKKKVLNKINYKLINDIIKIENTNLNNQNFTLT